MAFAAAAVERAMTYQQVIMRALAGSLTWLQAADILSIHPRSLRRWRARYERDPVLGLLDRRRQRPSHLTAPRAEVQRILHLYRERYPGFNVRHFHQIARREHAVTLSYTFVKLALQAAGLVAKRPIWWRARYERDPVLGLLDRRRQRPSHLTAPRAEVQRILHLYRERYPGFNVRHFHQIARREHAVTLSYTFVKLALQAAGLVAKRRARGRHRRRR